MKLYNVLNKLYGITMMISFFGAALPVIPFIIALIIGGPTGEAISVFLSAKFYPVVMVLASIAVLFGLAAMYAGKKQDFSLKTLNREEEKKENEEDK